MLIGSAGTKLNIYKIFEPLRDNLGNIVDNTDNAMYLIEAGNEYTATIISPFEFQLATPDVLEDGANILISNSTTSEERNTITNVGDVYRVTKKISGNIGTTITVKEDYNILNNIALEEGIYYFANNEALIVSNTFFNTRIGFNELNSRFKELPKNTDITSSNDEAIKSVLADFSFVPDFFRYIDMFQARELVLLKMLIWLNQGRSEDEYKQAIDNYNSYKSSVTNIIKVEADGSLNPGDTGSYGGGFTWSWGADADV